MNLLKTVTSFRKGILDGRASARMCAMVCLPLQGYLSYLGIQTKVIEADFPTSNHVWLELEDGRIIDPTADQFSGSQIQFPKVYIGPLPEIYSKWMAKPPP